MAIIVLDPRMSDWPEVNCRNETSSLRSAVLTHYHDRLSSSDGHRRRHHNNEPPKEDRRPSHGLPFTVICTA